MPLLRSRFAVRRSRLSVTAVLYLVSAIWLLVILLAVAEHALLGWW